MPLIPRRQHAMLCLKLRPSIDSETYLKCKPLHSCPFIGTSAPVYPYIDTQPWNAHSFLELSICPAIQISCIRECNIVHKWESGAPGCVSVMARSLSLSPERREEVGRKRGRSRSRSPRGDSSRREKKAKKSHKRSRSPKRDHKHKDRKKYTSSVP